ncbi:cytochrome P450 [Streptomyces sp. NPDC054844]
MPRRSPAHTLTAPAGPWRHAVHRDPELFRDPLRFGPDRRLDSDQPRPTHAFPPFGAGKHKCIGDRLALTELFSELTRVSRDQVTGRSVLRGRAGVGPENGCERHGC